MRLLCELDRQAALDYVMQEPEFNLFIIGDIENFGLDGGTVSVAVHETDERWDSMVLRYREHVIVYSPYDDYDAGAAAEYIKQHPYESIAGKGSVLAKLAPMFAETPRVTYMSRCDHVTPFPLPEGFEVRRLMPDDAALIVTMFSRIDEFKDDYIGCEEKKIEEERISLEKGGMGFGAFIDGEMVSYAGTTAENSQSAMIVGVATVVEYQGRGLASAVVSGLCQNCLSRGMKFLCLFYDNPKAGSIYHKIGFTELGEFVMLRHHRSEN